MFKKAMAVLSLIVVLIITYLGLPQEVGAAQTVEDIQDKGTLILGTSADYPPYEFHATIDGKDEIIGMDISLAEAIADELGVNLQIEDLGFDALLPALEAGTV
ncbi:MAG: transporter substrate-binding domain-containing protein, partial [Fibrobacter sp.]|nr:transporter substrate-binding domain-containing protein [Fibrobacter sp.]